MLPTYTTILVTTDLSPNSEYAFKHAVMLARQNRADIYLLHVVPEVDATFRSYISAVMGEGELDRLEKEQEGTAIENIKEELDRFARTELAEFPDDLERFVGTLVKRGDPVVEILRVADELKVDAIVMGTHGKGQLSYTFLGSVTKKLLRKSKYPVFAIPLPD